MRVQPVESVESAKVEISTIEDVERSCLVAELIENVYIVNDASRDNDYSGKVASQVEQRVQFDSGLVATKLGPRKERKAQIDRGRVWGQQHGDRWRCRACSRGK